MLPSLSGLGSNLGCRLSWSAQDEYGINGRGGGRSEKTYEKPSKTGPYLWFELEAKTVGPIALPMEG
jgi:hypothetical protein